MATSLVQQGFFSILRWRTDVVRDEAKNVAVVLVDPEGQFGGVKAAPLSRVSPRLHEQGILDALIVGLEKQFVARHKPDLDALNRMHESLERSVYLTLPRPVAVPDPSGVLEALYRAYVRPPSGGGAALTKGAVIDRLVDDLRKTGLTVRRGDYIGDFIFDLVIERQTPLVVDVLSFATTARDFTQAERDGGHFLYALERVNLKGRAVIKPPSDASHENARASHERVLRIFEAADVPVLEPSKVSDLALVAP